MSECEVCGKPISEIRKARIDGVIFQVCEDCVKLGEEIKVIEPIKKVIIYPVSKEEIELVPNFGEKIRKSRERKNLSQKKVAEKLKERLSIIKRTEQGFRPPEELIKKLERFFGIKLYEEIKEAKPTKKSKEEKLTLGDVAEIKSKRKN